MADVAPALGRLVKRLVIGHPMRSEQFRRTLLPKRIALPVFASDALSSVAYAPAEILLILSLGGLTAYTLSPWVGLAVAVVLLTVVASYRQNVRAYTSGGGDYEVASVNLGDRPGVAVASALLVDYVLTVAVSVSSGVHNLGSSVPFVADHLVVVAVVAVALMTAINLRGVRESGVAFAGPTYLFIAVVIGMVAFGLFRILVLGDDLRAESAGFELRTAPTVTGFALVFLLMRAFSSGCAALTGVEAIANGVPAFRPPRGRNAAATLAALGVIAVTMFLGILLLARYTGLVYVADPAGELVGAPEGYRQRTVLAQLADAVFDGNAVMSVLVTGATALILFLAANTAFSGFPVLGSVLARHHYLPRQLYTRGDRLAFSNGILMLAGFAVALIVGFRASETALIQLYIVGVFVSFTLSQIGMIRHWNRQLRTGGAARPSAMRRARAVNMFGAVMTGSVLVLVVATKFTQGAWISIAAMLVIYLTMNGIRAHYGRVESELEPRFLGPAAPTGNHAVVLVSNLDRRTVGALTYAQATRPDTLTAVTVNVSGTDTDALVREWQRHGTTTPLIVVDSPHRDVSGPVVNYIRQLRREWPRDLVTVFIPEYVTGHWWERLLHNLRIRHVRTRLRHEPGVVLTSVPWQLAPARAGERGGRRGGDPGATPHARHGEGS